MLDSIVKKVTVNDDDNTDEGGIVDTCSYFLFCGVDDFRALDFAIVDANCWLEILCNCTQQRMKKLLRRKVMIGVAVDWWYVYVAA